MPKHSPARIVGGDIDAFTVSWCTDNLVGDFRACNLSPPLDLPFGFVDFAYGYSVISHLTGPAQRAWFAELGRLFKPGALIVLTFHDPEHFAAPAIVVRDVSDGVSVTEWAMEGSNLVAAFPTINSTHEIAAPFFEPADHMDSHSSPFDQATAVLRRKPSTPPNKGIQ